MNPSYQWFTLGKEYESITDYNIIDIMGAPISDRNDFNNKLSEILHQNTLVCISGELKTPNEGKPASNFRYEKDEFINENVIQNYFELFRDYHSITYKPIVVTTIPRSWRLYSWKFTEEGTIIKKNNLTDDSEIHNELINMLYKFGIDNQKLKLIRESCKNSKYNSYLIDMISFIYQVLFHQENYYNIFKSEYRTPVSILGDEENTQGWKPNENMNYLYFDHCKNEDGYVFITPKEDSVENIYHLFELAISPYENKMKYLIRKHLSECTINRWSDFDVNDTDDAFTIIMILHSYTCDSIDHNPTSLSKKDYNIKKSIENKMKFWFDQLE